MARTRSGLALFALALIATILVACGGGGGSSASLPAASQATPSGGAPTSAPASTAQTVVVGAQAATVSLPAIATGVAATASLPAATSGAGTVTAQLSASVPAGGPAPQLANRQPKFAAGGGRALASADAFERLPSTIGASVVNPVAYVALTPSAMLSFTTTPALTFTVPSGTAPNGYWLALYDPSNANAGWQVVGGPATANGTTVAFAAQSTGFTLSANATTIFLLFAPGGTYPTPRPVAAPTASPAPAATSVACVSDAARTPLAGPRRAARASHGAAIVPGELYVSYAQSAGRSAQSLARGLQTVATTSLGAENGVAHAVISFAPGTDLRSAASALRAGAGVVAVAPLHYRALQTCTASANDQYANTSDQWYLYRTSTAATVAGAADGWSLSHGRGVTVAVIDTGADLSNRDLTAKLVFEESIITPTGGAQQVDQSGSAAQDTNGHGTNVAGLVAAATNNGYGFASIGWEVNLMIYRVFPQADASSDAQSANTADEAAAIRDAVARGASVISLSLGSPSYNNQGFDQAEHDAVEYAIAQGVTVVAAGGNEYPDVTGTVPDDPGAYPGVIAVGASAVQDAAPNKYETITSENAASYSNSGVALLAPGGDPASPAANDSDNLHWIEGYSTTTAGYPADTCSNSGGVCRALFAGTSQATPQVAATAALMMALHGGPKSLTPAQVLSILTQSADQLSGVPQSRQGAGRLNVYKALQNTH